ncbi:DUF3992 domain-containing protein [Solibacillus sp. FSL K6-1523]|uniref:DUF3992 domain-containing protein n=1 Tax=Solibacillus sp. FSL K6-1523 TaxID=2921471 RepID=UPI0030F76299
MSNERATVHCVKVPRVLDWITTSTVIKLKEKIQLDDTQLHDLICCNFSVPCGEISPTILWTTYGISQIGGTICINYYNGHGNPLTVFVNGEKQADVNEGNSFSGTFSHLSSIEVQCIENNGNIESCYGEFKIMFHFHPNDQNNFNSVQDIQKAICFLSDCHGKPLSLMGDCSVTWKELTSSKNRSNVYVQKALGETMMLQCIDFLIQGFVCVHFLNDAGEICFQSVFPFSEVETAFLCAPPGTKIHCQTIDVNCRAHIIPSFSSNTNCIEVVIILSICQSIKSVDDVIIELKGSFSHPRQELVLSSCNIKPPSL